MSGKRRQTIVIVGAASLAVAFAVMVYAAFAIRYSADTRNTITTGGVHITLNETTLIDTATGAPALIDPSTGAAVDGITAVTADFPAAEGGVANVLPGQAYAKRVSVTNRTGSQEAWVRVKVEKAFQNADGSDFAGDLSAIVLLGLNETDWEYDAGFYYYKYRLSAGETTTPLFVGVQLDGDKLDGSYANKKANVNVAAYAVQAKNNADGARTAAGWPE